MNVTQYLLRDGETLIVINKPGFHSVSVVAGVAAGSNNETYMDEFGLAHAVEHMLFKGTYDYTKQQLTSDLVRQGCSLNAFTSYDRTAITGHGPVKMLPAMLKQFIAMLQTPTFPQEEWDVERGVVLQEEQERKTYLGTVSYTAIDMNIVEGAMTNYNHPIIGEAESIQGFTVDMMKQFHSEHYTRCNQVIVVAGPVEPKEVLDLVESIKKNAGHWVGDWSCPSSEPTVTVPELPEDAQAGFGTIKVPYAGAPDQIQTSVLFPQLTQGHPWSSYNREQSVRQATMFSAATDLLDEFGGILWNRLREERGLVYSFGFAHIKTWKVDCPWCTFTASPENTPEVLKIMQDTIMEAIEKNDIVTAKTVEERKAVSEARLEMRQDALPGLARSAFAAYCRTGAILTEEQERKLIGEISVDNLKDALMSVAGLDGKEPLTIHAGDTAKLK